MKPLDSRLQKAKRYFREHHAAVEPDAGFAGRVVSNLRREPVEALAWTALKMLPAALALVFVMAWIVSQADPAVDSVAELSSGGTEDLLSWVLEDPEAAR